MYVKRAQDAPAEKVEAGQGTHRQVLISDSEGPHFAMRKFAIESGGGMPRHTNEVEHEQYVLGGRGRIGIGDQVFEVSANDVVFIPARVPHWYESIGDEDFEFLCVVPNLPDRTELVPETK